jgi:hypothetical protein
MRAGDLREPAEAVPLPAPDRQRRRGRRGRRPSRRAGRRARHLSKAGRGSRDDPSSSSSGSRQAGHEAGSLAYPVRQCPDSVDQISNQIQDETETIWNPLSAAALGRGRVTSSRRRLERRRKGAGGERGRGDLLQAVVRAPKPDRRLPSCSLPRAPLRSSCSWGRRRRIGRCAAVLEAPPTPRGGVLLRKAMRASRVQCVRTHFRLREGHHTSRAECQSMNAACTKRHHLCRTRDG